MASGLPLQDADRWPWLLEIRAWMSGNAEKGNSTMVTCSALKRSYLDVLSTAHGDVLFIHLDGSPVLLRQRMEARRGHFMPESLLPSQLAALVPLGPDEPGMTIDIIRLPRQIAGRILDHIRIPAVGQKGADPGLPARGPTMTDSRLYVSGEFDALMERLDAITPLLKSNAEANEAGGQLPPR